MTEEIIVDDRQLRWFEKYNPGSHVSGWASIVKARGGEAEALLKQFYDEFAALDLYDVAMKEQEIQLSGIFSERRNQLVIHKKIGGIKAVVIVDIRANERGDLLCSWFLFERDWFTQLWWFVLAFIVAVISADFLRSMFSPDPLSQFTAMSLFPTVGIVGFLIVVYLVGRGFGWWGRLYKTSPANPFQRFDSAVLARYVDMTIKEVLAQAGVSDNEIEEIRFADASWIEERRERRVKE
jgi:hypothetical protein